MKVHTRLLYEYNPKSDDFVLIEDDWYEYHGPVEQAKGGGGGDTTTVQQADPWVGLQPYLGDIYQQAQQTYYGKTPQFYPGESFAQLSPEQLQSQQMALGQTGAQADIASRAQESLSFGLSPDILSPETNPYLAQQGEAITQRLGQSYAEQIMPGIRGGAQAAGQYGGSRQGVAEGIASRGLLQAQGDALSQLYGGAYGQGLSAMGRAQALAPSIQNLGLAPSQTYGQVGAQNQALEQARINDALAKWNFEQGLPAQQLSNYAGILSGIPLGAAGSSTSRASGSAPGGGFSGTGAVGGATAGFSTFGVPGAIGGAILGGFF